MSDRDAQLDAGSRSRANKQRRSDHREVRHTLSTSGLEWRTFRQISATDRATSASGESWRYADALVRDRDRTTLDVLAVLEREMTTQVLARPPTGFVHQLVLRVLKIRVLSPPERSRDRVDCGRFF